MGAPISVFLVSQATQNCQLGWSVRGIWGGEGAGLEDSKEEAMAAIHGVDRSNSGELLATGDGLGLVRHTRTPRARQIPSSPHDLSSTQRGS